MAVLELHRLPEKGSDTLTLRLPKTTNQRLTKVSIETGISKNAIINKMILFGLENMQIND